MEKIKALVARLIGGKRPTLEDAVAVFQKARDNLIIVQADLRQARLDNLDAITALQEKDAQLGSAQAKTDNILRNVEKFL